MKSDSTLDKRTHEDMLLLLLGCERSVTRRWSTIIDSDDRVAAVLCLRGLATWDVTPHGCQFLRLTDKGVSIALQCERTRNAE